MARFGIISDDFTGACDVGIQFKKYGMETVVLASLEALSKVKNFEVVVIDIDSRNDPPDAAYDKAKAAAKALKGTGVTLVYKKMDSTLRGNIGAELDSAMSELNLKAALIAPAFPAANRTTLDGRQLLNGVPLDRTDFAHDPINPVRQSHIPTLVQGQTQRKIETINLSRVREGIGSLKREIQSLIESGNEILVVDAETQDDLKAIAKAALDSKVLPCGSAGLAEEVCYWLVSSLLQPRLLVVSGSVNNVTLNQICVLQKTLDVHVLEPDLLVVLAGGENRKSEAVRLIEEAKKAVDSGRDVVMRLAKSSDEIFKIQEFGRKVGMDHRDTARKILSFLGETSSVIIDGCNIERLILIGGDTATSVVNALGAYGIGIRDEVLPGIPLGIILGGDFDGLLAVTKAGGFGQEDALIGVVRKLRSLRLILGMPHVP